MSLIKRTSIIALAVTCIICVMPAQGRAGTFIVGAKTWTAMWDSWMGQNMEATAGGEAELGIGIMAGPVLGYQTDEGTWSVSAAIMALSYFKQKMEVPDGGGGTVNMDADCRRMDFDFAVNYAFLTYFKVFAGYKLQTYKTEYTMTGLGAGTYTMKMMGHIPTVGLAAVYPLTDSLIAGIQAGFLYAVLDDLKLEAPGQPDDSMNMKNGLGFNAEIGLNYILMENVMIQGGFRYQQVQVVPDQPNPPKSSDRFFGITLGAVYMI